MEKKVPKHCRRPLGAKSPPRENYPAFCPDRAAGTGDDPGLYPECTRAKQVALLSPWHLLVTCLLRVTQRGGRINAALATVLGPLSRSGGMQGAPSRRLGPAPACPYSSSWPAQPNSDPNANLLRWTLLPFGQNIHKSRRNSRFPCHAHAQSLQPWGTLSAGLSPITTKTTWPVTSRKLPPS